MYTTFQSFMENTQRYSTGFFFGKKINKEAILALCRAVLV